MRARQGIALRGHDESSTSTNKGNYVETLVVSIMPQLGRQFRSPPNNTNYTSKVVQKFNDLLKAATDVVLKQNTNESKNAEEFA